MDNPYSPPLEDAQNLHVLIGRSGSDRCPNCTSPIDRNWVSKNVPLCRCNQCDAKLSMDLRWYWKSSQACLFAIGLVCWYFLITALSSYMLKLIFGFATIAFMSAILAVYTNRIRRRFGYPVARLEN
jgi:hypothetical protein